MTGRDATACGAACCATTGKQPRLATSTVRGKTGFLPESLLKTLCYGLLLLLVLAQILAGATQRGAISNGSARRYGFATGVLYGLTTISGPTLAAYAQRRGYGKDDARAALSVLRALEGAISLAALFLLGLFTWPSLRFAAFLQTAGLLGLFAGHRQASKVYEFRFPRI